MANVAHSTLTGADLHEPKGVASAASGTVYIADGAGSGDWNTVASALSFVGMIAPFATPVAPSGWFECDGSTKSRTTYSALFESLTIQQTGTRTSGTAVIVSLSDTSNMKAGYYVGGSGIPGGATILSVDSSTQITLSANATSSGTSTIIVSPWGLGDYSTTFTLPDLTTSGRYLRSRTSSVAVGTAQADQNKAHTHSVSATTSGTDGTHTHTITDPGHTHSERSPSSSGANTNSGGVGGQQTETGSSTTGITINSTNSGHGHTITVSESSSGGTEVRPLTTVVMYCIKY